MNLLPALLLISTVPAGPWAPRQEPGRTVVSVLAPLDHGAGCWSTVTLQNLGNGAAEVDVEAHKSSGALSALTGAQSIPVTLTPSQKITLRFEAEEDGIDGWIKVGERISGDARGPVVAVSGTTECRVGDKLTTVPQPVAYPVRNPWLATDLGDVPGRLLFVLNASPEPATARACYSNGSTATVPKGAASEVMLVCTEALAIQIPPFGARRIPFDRGGNSYFSAVGTGESIVMQVLELRRGSTKTYTVDSTVKFLDPAGRQ